MTSPTAEDLVQDAVLAALQRWPTEGVPERPDAWLFTVARNRGLDVLRRENNYRAKLAQLQWPVQPERDERLRLIFTCCHPALPREAQIALTLRVVCGLTTAQIARAFLVPETTVAQRITRAKRKITEAGIPYRVPDPDELNARLREVLAVIYLLLNEGYLSTADQTESRDLVDDAEWLASQLYGLMPTEPEVAGLLALIRLHRARAEARFDRDGGLVLLEHQNRSNWNRASDRRRDSTAAPRRQAASARPVPAAGRHRRLPCRSRATGQDTDWEQIVLLYDMLLHLAPSPLTRLHRSIALRYPPGRKPPWPKSTPSQTSSTSTTSTTPPAPSCFGRLATRFKLGWPTNVPWNSRQTPLSKPSCGDGSTRMPSIATVWEFRHLRARSRRHGRTLSRRTRLHLAMSRRTAASSLEAPSWWVSMPLECGSRPPARTTRDRSQRPCTRPHSQRSGSWRGECALPRQSRGVRCRRRTPRLARH